MRWLAWFLAFGALLVAPSARAFLWPNAVERIAAALTQGDVEARRQAARRLTELPRAVAERLTLRALEDTDVEVRVSAAHAALGLGVEGASQSVTRWLTDSDRRLRLLGAELLSLEPQPRSISALGRALGDADADVRVAAAKALGASGLSDAVAPLLGHLDDATPSVRVAVVVALGRLRDPRSVVPLIGKIQDTRSDVRRAVVRALGQLGDARAGSALILSLRDGEPEVRAAALGSLPAVAAPDAVVAVTALLREETDVWVRTTAQRALGSMASTQDLGPVIDALGSEIEEEGQGAEQALVDAGDRARPALLACLEGRADRRVVAGCASALATIGGAEAAPALQAGLASGRLAAAAALRALGTLGDSRALAVVLEQLRAPDPEVRVAAIDAASELLDPATPDGRAVDPIVTRLRGLGLSISERMALIRLLGRTGSPRARPLLEELVREADDERVVQAAAEALGLLGPLGQDRVLLAALDSASPGVRWTAALALRRSASARSAAALLDRWERRGEQDRLAVATALGGALSKVVARPPHARLERLTAASRDGPRDALIEAWSRLSGAPPWLLRFAEASGSPADRAKVAEVLGGAVGAAPSLRRLLADPDGSVRAAAAWSLGSAGERSDLPRLVRALSDRDVAVAANAAAALGRLARRLGTASETALCEALEDPRTYVRANALASLSLLERSCDRGLLGRMLERDQSNHVRERLAALHWAAAAAGDREASLMLERCAEEDTSGRAAIACRTPSPSPSGKTFRVTVFVMTATASEPVARAPFALVCSDRLVRLGLADRRGAVFEPAAPAGPLRLEVPALLEE
jgi:HEAT repeat protein